MIGIALWGCKVETKAHEIQFHSMYIADIKVSEKEFLYIMHKEQQEEFFPFRGSAFHRHSTVSGKSYAFAMRF
jgi:hypothetical protein